MITATLAFLWTLILAKTADAWPRADAEAREVFMLSLIVSGALALLAALDANGVFRDDQ